MQEYVMAVFHSLGVNHKLTNKGVNHKLTNEVDVSIIYNERTLVRSYVGMAWRLNVAIIRLIEKCKKLENFSSPSLFFFFLQPG